MRLAECVLMLRSWTRSKVRRNALTSLFSTAAIVSDLVSWSVKYMASMRSVASYSAARSGLAAVAR